MQTTSATWKALWASGSAWLDVKAVIDGVEYTRMSNPVITRGLTQGGLSVGNAVSATCRFSVLTEDAIPRAAEVVVQMRLTDGTTASEWLSAGTFYIAHRTRDAVTGLLTLECYDALLKANAQMPTLMPWTDDGGRVMTTGDGEWLYFSASYPRAMASLVRDLALYLGVEMDSRTALREGAAYVIGAPDAGSTIHDALARIAAANGGNWIITPAGRLRLVPVISAAGAAGAEDDVIDVAGVTGAVTVQSTGTITGVRYPAEGAAMLLGDDSGIVVEADVGAAIAQDVYDDLEGMTYQAFALNGAIYDPAAELGDYVRGGASGEVSGVLYSEAATLGLAFRGDIGAPEPGEMSDEYPYIGVNAKTLTAAKVYAAQQVAALNDSLDQQGIFNRLTDNGQVQGLILYDGQLYINASYINTGTLSANRISGGTIDGNTVNAKLLNIVDANGNVIASFNNVITLGKATDAHAEMDFNSFEIVDKGGELFFTVGDARDANGQATVADRFTGDGGSDSFVLTVTAISVEGVTIDGTAASGWSLAGSGQEILLATAPADGAEIVVTYVTTDPVYRYDIGTRWSGSVIGVWSVAEGYYVEASGFGSHAEGQATHARGYLSHAEGYYSQANGYAAHAEGFDTQAGAPGSHAEGWLSEASGGFSHAEGWLSKASGGFSHAEGAETVASGNYSHAEGQGTRAAGACQHVFGRYNADAPGSLEIVGNGWGADSRSNARTLDANGNEWIAGALSVDDVAGTRKNLGIICRGFSVAFDSSGWGTVSSPPDGYTLMAGTFGSTDWMVSVHTNNKIRCHAAGNFSSLITSGTYTVTLLYVKTA